MIEISGEYVPFGVQNVRPCPYIVPGCAIVGRLSGGVAVQAYGMLVVYPQGDVWLCLDPGPAMYVSSNCERVVALVIAGREFGGLVLY